MTPSADALRERAHRLIPAGCHTYSKGDDQFPANAPAFIVRGDGCHVWDSEDREFIDWGMGLRSVVLGHAHPRVNEAAIAAIKNGTNFTRPSPIEADLAEQLIEMIPAAEMVKFAKNGSDVTTAAVRLARAYTGRDLVAFPAEHPFYSVDDWFIGSTPMNAGIPQAVQDLSVRFHYNDLDSARALFEQHPGQIAAIITECATTTGPEEGFLEGLRELTEAHGALLIFDEMITGFRMHAGGAQSYFGVTPDIATFGKGMANGFSVAALVGRREVLELGGLHHDRPRVFLLSTTHGGETHSLAAGLVVADEFQTSGVADQLWAVGGRLQEGLNSAARAAGVSELVRCVGFGASPGMEFAAAGDVSPAGIRTLFLQEMVERGVLIPYIAPSAAHDDESIDRTIDAAEASFAALRRVADGEPLESLLVGPPTRPVFRQFNTDV